MRLIDADDLLAKVHENAPGFMDSGSTITKAFIMAMINTKSVAPTIDAVPIVRCKDCKHRSKEMYDYYGNPEDKVYVCQINDVAKKPNWFCADGETDNAD